jgi:hypothetical protein
MTSQSEIDRDKAVVDGFYQAGIEGHLTSFARYLDLDFKVTAPNYLPWGGTHSGAAFFRDEILPYLPNGSTSHALATTALFWRAAASPQ